MLYCGMQFTRIHAKEKIGLTGEREKMKRLLFVPALVFAGVIAGCKTELLDPSGKPVLDASGRPVMVPRSMKARIGKTSLAVQKEINSAIASAASRGAWADVAKFKLPESRIKDLLGPEATQEEIDALKAVAETTAKRHRTEVVYPAHLATDMNELSDSVALALSGSSDNRFTKASNLVVNIKKTGIAEIDEPLAQYAAELNKGHVAPALAMDVVGRRVKPRIKGLLAKGQFDQAREMLWSAPTTGNSEADALIRLFTVEAMLVDVNPAEWAAIEAELNTKTAEFVKGKKFDEAIAWLKAYRRVRTHPANLGARLKAVEAELAKAGVHGKDMETILDATGDMVGRAEKIVDMIDTTTDNVAVVEGMMVADVSPDLEDYKAKLGEYRKMLLRYSCTEDAARKIVDVFNMDVNPLLAALSRPVAKEGYKANKKACRQLGTGALNARIDKMTSKLLKDVQAKKAGTHPTPAWLRPDDRNGL